jgi:CBS domain-containing protein
MGMKITDSMTENPCTIDADKPVSYAAKMMRDEDVGFAPIVEGDRLVGTLTDRDIAVRVVAEGRNPDETLVREVATDNLITVEPEDDLDEAMKLMARYQVRRVAVVDGGRLIGVVAQGDIARDAKAKQTGEVVEEISE